MKTKKPLIAIIMLALAAFAAHADEKVDALGKAAGNNNAAEVRRLIAAGTDVDARDDEGMTALMFAKSADVAKLLIEAGANVDAKDYALGWSALIYAAARDAVDVAQLLLADALGEAAGNNNAAEVRRLIADGADVNAKDYYGMTALIYAAQKNHPDIVKLLIGSGADVNAKDITYGETALRQAAWNSSPEIAKLLIDAGADMNATNNHGWTALMNAAAKNAAEVARLLLAAGADVNAKNDDGQTALMLADDFKATNVAELLKAAGAE